MSRRWKGVSSSQFEQEGATTDWVPVVSRIRQQRPSTALPLATNVQCQPKEQICRSLHVKLHRTRQRFWRISAAAFLLGTYCAEQKRVTRTIRNVSSLLDSQKQVFKRKHICTYFCVGPREAIVSSVGSDSTLTIAGAFRSSPSYASYYQADEPGSDYKKWIWGSEWPWTDGCWIWRFVLIVL